MPKPFRYIEPTFFAGLFDDPLLLLRVRPAGRALLFDCGKMHHLAKRVYTSIDAIFISHAHMDHFMGMDSVIRHSHASPRTVEIFGPPGLAAHMASKFACYDWNLADTFWGDFRVGEIGEGRITSTLFKGAEGFVAYSEGEREGVVYSNRHLTVRSTVCEHNIPVLAYRVDEGAAFVVDDARMAEAGVVKGDWLKTLEKLFHTGTMGGNAIAYPARDGEIVEERWAPDAAALYQRIRKVETPASIGYVTDVGYSEENVEKLAALVGGVTLLVCECAFLASHQRKARLSRHLCTTDLNMLLDRLRPTYVLPMHFSKTYQGESEPLYRELEPPPGVTVLKIPDRMTPRPIMESEVPKPIPLNGFACRPAAISAKNAAMKKNGSNDAPLVYSSEFGRICPGCGKPASGCVCRKNSAAPAGDGFVRIRRESKGRGGKTVMVITGLPLDVSALTALAGELKRRCGCGGTAKDGVIEIQGDHGELLLSELARRGYKAKRAGG